jgi:uncharacterized protein
MPNTVHRSFFEDLLTAHREDKTKFSAALEFPLGEQVQRLCDGEIDAFGMVTGVPSSVIRGAINRCGGSLVQLDTAETDRLIYDRPYLTPLRIQAGAYGRDSQLTATFAVTAVATTTADLPDDIAYRIVHTVFENLASLKAMHPALATLEPKGMIKDGISIPFHPGAIRYFVEKGLMEAPLTASELQQKQAREQAAALLESVRPITPAQTSEPAAAPPAIAPPRVAPQPAPTPAPAQKRRQRQPTSQQF